MAVHLVLVRDDVLLATEKPLIKARDYAVLLEANDILDKAHKKSSQILSETEQKMATAAEQGYASGYARALEDFAARILNSKQTRLERQQKLHEYLSYAVAASLRAVLGELPPADILERLIKQSIASIKPESQIYLRVASSDVAFANAALQKMNASEHYPAVELVSDERISPLSCVFESEEGIVDASLEMQLSALERAITRELRQSSLEADED